MTVWRLIHRTPGGSAPAGAEDMLNAWPSTRCAAAMSEDGESIGGRRQHDRVGRQLDVALANAGAQPDPSSEAAVGRERAVGDRTGLLRDQRELRGDRVSRRDGLEADSGVGDELRARHRARVQIDADQVGRRLRGIGDGGVQVVALAGSHRARVSQRDRKRRIAHEHAAERLPHESHGARRQAVERCVDGEVDRLAAFLETLDQKLRRDQSAEA